MPEPVANPNPPGPGPIAPVFAEPVSAANINQAATTQLGTVRRCDGINAVSISSVLASGSWGAAVIAIEGSVTGAAPWTEISTITAAGNKVAVDLTGYAFYRLAVKTDAGGAGTVNFNFYGYVAL